MDKERVVKIRDMLKSIKFPIYNRGTGEEKMVTPYIQVVCDNSVNAVDDNQGSIIWDDENDIFYWFKANAPGSTIFHPSMAMGVAVKTAYLVIAVDYDEIQNIRMPMNQECFDQIATKIPMTEEQKNHIEDMILTESDMRNVFAMKRSTNYVTGLPSKYDIPSGSDSKVYAKTIHSDQSGAI